MRIPSEVQKNKQILGWCKSNIMIERHDPRIVIIGLGDLGKRITFALAVLQVKARVCLASRNASAGKQIAGLASACLGRAVDFACVDGTSEASCRDLLKKTQPDIVVQCASLVSPWAAFGKARPELVAFRAAGFAANLAAQLPVITNLMRAINDLNSDCTVINCSYPDVTNTILHALGRAPDIGIGNVGMIRRLIEQQVPDQFDQLRLFAHHSQVWPYINGENGVNTLPVRVYSGNIDVSGKIGQPKSNVPVDKNLNALAAAHAIDVVLAYLKVDGETKTSAPGVLGLPGGWPVRIADRKAHLDLPRKVSCQEMIQYQNKVALIEGIQEIAADGTVYFTERLYRTLPNRFKVLGEPLAPDKALERALHLKQLISQV